MTFLSAFENIPASLDDFNAQLAAFNAPRVAKKAPPRFVVAYSPPSELFARYREALDVAIKNATKHNVTPIRGATVILISFANDMDSECRGARSFGSTMSKMRSVAVLLGLMCREACEECDVVLFSGESGAHVRVKDALQALYKKRNKDTENANDDNENVDEEEEEEVEGVAAAADGQRARQQISDDGGNDTSASGSILVDVQDVLALQHEPNVTHLHDSSQRSFFPYQFVKNAIEQRRHIDNLIVLSSGGFDERSCAVGGYAALGAPLSVGDVLNKYRATCNPRLLYVNIVLGSQQGLQLSPFVDPLSSGSGSTSDAAEMARRAQSAALNVNIGGYSDSILRFIAERGELNLLAAVECIDVEFNLRGPSLSVFSVLDGQKKSTAQKRAAKEALKIAANANFNDEKLVCW